MVLSNDDDDAWQYKLFADDGVNDPCSETWTSLGSGEKATLTLDISAVGSDSEIGFMMGSDYEQRMHTSTEIPEPCMSLLIGLGGLALLRKRKA